MEEDEAFAPDQARAALKDVARLRRRTCRERQAFWFPLVVFAVLTLGSAPLYVSPSPSGTC